MVIESLLAAGVIILISLVGVFFFGSSGRLVGIEKYSIPVAVGVFLSVVLYELIPETLEASPDSGGLAVAFGFISFYILASVLHKTMHKKYQHLKDDECDRKGAAMLILIGDSIHNVSDGIVLGGAFLINPAAGVVTAIGLALHELPQEIVEFGILMRAGYSRSRASLYNLISASSILIGLGLIFYVSELAAGYIWVITGVAAGNLLFIAASDLLPRIHGNLKNYGGIWQASLSIIVGFLLMTVILSWSHERFDAHPEHLENENQENLVH